MIVEILIENSRGVFEGQLGQDNIYAGAHVYIFRVVPGGFLDNLVLSALSRAHGTDFSTRLFRI